MLLNSYSRLKPLTLVHHRRKGVSKVINSAFVSCISSPALCPTRTHHFTGSSAGSSRDVPSTINFSSDELPRSQMNSSMDQSATERSSNSSHVHAGGRLACLPEIPRLPSFSSYLPSSPSFISSVACQPDQVYHRPFCGPSICPVTRPSQLEGIVVTVHRHASIDIIV